PYTTLFRSTEGGDLQGHVAGAADAVLGVPHLDHRHRRLGGNPRGAAVPVAVEHQIADHQHLGAVEAGEFEFHRGKPVVKWWPAQPPAGKNRPTPAPGPWP